MTRSSGGSGKGLNGRCYCDIEYILHLNRKINSQNINIYIDISLNINKKFGGLNIPVNVLEWITCPKCGITFQIAVPKETIRLLALPTIREGSLDDFFYIHCPKCKMSVYIHIYYKKE